MNTIHHTLVPFMNSIEFYVHAPQEIVIDAFFTVLKDHIPQLHIYQNTPYLTSIAVYLPEGVTSSKGSNHHNLLHINKLGPNRYVNYERSKVSIFTPRNIDEILTHINQIMKTINALEWKRVHKRGRHPFVFPKVHSEICRIDLVKNIHSRRISYELLLSIVDRDWHLLKYNVMHRVTAFIGDKINGRTLYLGNTRRSKFSIRLHEHGKLLAAEGSTPWPLTGYRIAAVYRFPPDKRLHPVSFAMINYCNRISSQAMQKHPLITVIDLAVKSGTPGLAYSNVLHRDLADKVLEYSDDATAYARFANIDEAEVQAMMMDDINPAEYFAEELNDYYTQCMDNDTVYDDADLIHPVYPV